MAQTKDKRIQQANWFPTPEAERSPIQKRGRLPKKGHLPRMHDFSFAITEGSLEDSLRGAYTQLWEIYRDLQHDAIEESFQGLQAEFLAEGLTGAALITSPEPLYGGLKFFYVAMAFFVEADLAHRSENHDQAWSKLCMAHYFCGVASVFFKLPEIPKKFLRKHEREGQDNELKIEAVRFYQSLGETDKPRVRARKTRDHIRQYATRLNAERDSDSQLLVLVDTDSGTETVERWIDESYRNPES